MSVAVESVALADDASRRSRLRTGVAAVVLMAACSGMTMLPVFRDFLQTYLEIDDRGFGLLFSIGTMAGLVAILPGGLLIDRGGPVKVMRLCLFGEAVAFLTLALAGHHWWLVAVGMGIHGMMFRPVGVAVNAFLVSLFPHLKRRALSLNFVAVSAGETFFPALAESLLFVSHHSDSVSFGLALHAPFGVLGVSLFIATLFFRPAVTRTNGPDTGPIWHPRTFHFRRSTSGLIVLGALHGTADSILFCWWARFLGSAAFDAQPIPPGFFLSAFSIGYALSRVLLAWLPEHRWRRRLMVVPGLLGGSILIAGILSRNYMLTGCAYVAGAFMWSAEFPTFLSRIAEEAGPRFASAAAVQQMLSAGLSALGLLGMGVLINAIGEAAMWKAMVLPAAVFPCVGLGGWWWLLAHERNGPGTTS